MHPVRHGRQRRDLPGEFPRPLLEFLPCRRYADDPCGFGPRRGNGAPAQQQIRGLAGAGEAQQPVDVRVRNRDAPLRRRKPERGVERCDPNVRAERDLQPSSQAVAPDDRDGRLREIGERVARRVNRLPVVPRPLGRTPRLLEIRDVRPRRKRQVPRARHDHDPNLGVRVQFLEQVGQAAPHRVRDRVAPLRPVDRKRSDRAAALNEDRVFRFVSHTPARRTARGWGNEPTPCFPT